MFTVQVDVGITVYNILNLNSFVKLCAGTRSEVTYHGYQ